MKFLKRTGVLILASTVFISGCATQYAAQTTVVKYYPDCYAPLNNLRKAEKDFNKSVVSGVVAGSLLGAVAGLLISGKMEGAAAGAVAGGVAGGAVGYGQAKEQETRHLAGLLAELDGDISGLDTINASGRLALQCYDRSFNTALKDFKAKRVSRTELDARYKEIRDGSDEALKLMKSQARVAEEKEIQYRQALEQEARTVDRPVPTVAAPSKKSGKTAPAKKKQAQSSDPLTRMAEQTQTFSQSRAELESDISTGNTLRDSWEQDLASIRS